MGITWISEGAEDFAGEVAYQRHLDRILVSVPVACPVRGCEWVAIDGESLADHRAVAHPRTLPRLLVNGSDARAMEILRSPPDAGDLQILGDGQLEFTAPGRPTARRGSPADLAAAMRSSSGAGDWLLRLHGISDGDIVIQYRLRLRVLADDQMRAIDQSFLQTFSRRDLPELVPLEFAQLWSGNTVSHEYAGVLADAMRYLARRSATMAEPLGDGGYLIRRLALFQSSPVAAMVGDLLRLCELDIATGASQSSLPALAFVLDVLAGLADPDGLVGPPQMPNVSGGGTRGLYVDSATEELLDAAIALSALADPSARVGQLAAWASKSDRQPSDCVKALALAVVFASASDPRRRVWATELVHHPALGTWAMAVRDGER